MEITGKSIINNTYLYIYPCLLEHGTELMLRMRRFYKLGVAVGDDYDTLPFGEYVYIVFDNTERRIRYQEDFRDFLTWVRQATFYEKDYTYSEQAHVLVLRLPDKFYDLPAKLVESKYGNIYTKDEMQRFYNEKYISITPELKTKVVSVIGRNKNYFPTFVKEVNKRFATDFSEHELSHIEDYELGLILSENVLNYNVMAGQ